MKKILIFALLISYSVASLGVSLNYFYCCGKLKSVSVQVNKETTNCSGKLSKDCCGNKTVTLQLKTDQKESSTLNYQFNTATSPAIVYTNSYAALNSVDSYNQKLLYKNPPEKYYSSLNVLYCVFRI
ncbi:MAG: hypothetical protein JST94_03685 [Bacteroidetes bacterium]|nr:hypothetical protein [Bacteroidota bacterium]MBS1670540.1 hypothetical protein [Bacteroidota bacterium]